MQHDQLRHKIQQHTYQVTMNVNNSIKFQSNHFSHFSKLSSVFLMLEWELFICWIDISLKHVLMYSWQMTTTGIPYGSHGWCLFEVFFVGFFFFLNKRLKNKHGESLQRFWLTLSTNLRVLIWIYCNIFSTSIQNILLYCWVMYSFLNIDFKMNNKKKMVKVKRKRHLEKMKKLGI